ncbi:MAG: TonB-dependent receptor [Acidobacteriia bacterium]|nr:TonB-dependent receptor [Terriglobia bacterium]
MRMFPEMLCLPRTPRVILLLGALASLCLAPREARAQAVRVEGTVRDARGAAVSGAEVKLRCQSYQSSQTADGAGGFFFDGVPGTSGTLLVQARGFEASETQWSATAGGTAQLHITLSLETMRERVSVTATRTETRLGDTPASSLVLNAEDVAATPALTLDDLLRQVPGFGLFRRSGSRTANPTAQGVSLRGLGASGASRTLVLEDGLPLNDPFGGWVYWGRVPRAAVACVEVVRGGASDLYGSDALGGVIQLRTRRAEPGGLRLETSYGNEQTPDVSVWAGGETRGWEAAIAAAAFHTEGYILVPDDLRGSVDTRAGSAHETADLMVGRRIGAEGRIFARGIFYSESRQNGTPLQINDTAMGEGVLGGEGPLGRFGALAVHLRIQAQTLHQNFSAIAANRMSETLTNQQSVPAQSLGGSVQWTRAAGKRQTLVAGMDADEVQGASEERIFLAGNLSALTHAGGRQRTEGFFAEDILRLGSNWIVTAAVRFDHWRNFDAQATRMRIAPPGPTTVSSFAERTESAFNPRLSVLRRLSANLALTASAYRAFRAPTLNELYRSFRVGNVLTLSNAGLRAERLTGGEAGLRATAFGGKLDLRGTFFWNEIVNPIANVTLLVQPTLLTRMRENLGRTRSLGVELDGVAHVSRSLDLSGGYQYAAATVRSFPADTSLVGLWVPQVPHQQFTLQGQYAHGSGLRLSVLGRYGGGQFEDDKNTLFLDPYFSLDVQAARPVARGFEAFVAVENLLNRRYTVGLTPVPTLGPPLLARVGLRWRFHGR